ncbi:MAG: AIPR family protein [Oscillospiraceae bacterium]
MNNSQWLEILISRKNLISDCLPTPLDNYNNLYLLETINKDTLNDEVMLICDSSHKGAIFDYNAIVSVTESLDIDVQPVIVFNNWEEERNTYWAYYDIQKKAVDRKNFSDWYEKKISIYTDCANSVELEIEDEGINYLEYSNNSSDLKLSGRVYNISFFELKKLFNVTGAHLFVNNVRYGIKKHQTGDLLKTKFREYLCGAIYSVLKSRSMIEEKDDEQIIEILGVNPREIQEPNLLSENFWFYHNGVTIFCYGIDDFETPRNKVRLTPNNVSVINGAQTLTNFFSEVESIKRYVMGDIISLVPNLNSKELLDSVIRGIFVKTIIIVGDSSYVRPITHGLNTQIPILQEDLLANSPNVENINNILKNNKSRVKIIKEGESWSGEYGVSVLDFAKHWLTINNKPGNSKNLGKKKLDPILIDALETLNQSPHQYIEKLGKLLDIYEWWEDSKQIRYESTSHNASQDSIYRYGKNYFGAYTLNYSTELFDIDDSKMIMIYEEFEKDLLATGHDLGLGEFKKDDLTALMLFHREQRKSSHLQRLQMLYQKTYYKVWLSNFRRTQVLMHFLKKSVIICFRETFKFHILG